MVEGFVPRFLRGNGPPRNEFSGPFLAERFVRVEVFYIRAEELCIQMAKEENGKRLKGAPFLRA